MKYSLLCAVVAFAMTAGTAAAKQKPSILIIWGDDIGPYDVSAYNMGRTDYKTPNIDRIAEAGIIFTDAYGDQSCTAGRALFITGQPWSIQPARDRRVLGASCDVRFVRLDTSIDLDTAPHSHSRWRFRGRRLFVSD